MTALQPTQFAAKLIDLAAHFQTECGERQVFVGGQTYVLSMTTPELSTSGGRHLVQHLRLTSFVGPTGPAIVFGTVRQSARTVELRSLSYVVDAHAQRTRGAWLELDPLTFNPMMEAVQAFFEQQGYVVTIVEQVPPPEPKSLPPAMEKQAPRFSPALMAAAGGVMTMLSVAAWIVLR